MVADVLCTEVHRVALAEEAVEVLARELYFLRARDKDLVLVAGVGEHAFEARHLLGVDLRPHLVAHEEELGLGVVHKVVNLLRVELVEDGHCHSTVGQRGQEGYAPACTVAAADGHFIAFLHA